MKNLKNKNVLVTGGAGFIGSHLVDALLPHVAKLVVLDNFDIYYDPQIKQENISQHLNQENYSLVRGDIRSNEYLEAVFRHSPFDIIIHLAALAGVRPSLKNPTEYLSVNVLGTQRLIENIIKYSPKAKFIFASSSSVYGNSTKAVFSETDNVNSPISPYGVSKITGELLCHTAYKNHNLNSIALRFFTVYGPRQRPDLAINKFCQNILKNQPILMYGDGSTVRDYTYISDIIDGIIKSIDYANNGFEIFNLGGGQPVNLRQMITTLESALDKSAIVIKYDKQVGDMDFTSADITKAKQLLKWQPVVTFPDGVTKFKDWLINNYLKTV